MQVGDRVTIGGFVGRTVSAVVTAVSPIDGEVWIGLEGDYTVNVLRVLTVDRPSGGHWSRFEAK